MESSPKTCKANCSLGSSSFYEDVSELDKCNEMEYTSSKSLEHGIVEPSSWVLSLFLGLQAVTVLLMSVIWLPMNFMDALCILSDDPVRLQVISLLMLVTGLSTIIFNTFQHRLHVLLVPSIRYFNNASKNLLKHHECPGSGDLFAMGYTKRTLEWNTRMNIVQSGLIITNLLTALAVVTGLCRAFDRILSKNSVLVSATVALALSQTEDLFLLRKNTDEELTLEDTNSVYNTNSKSFVIILMTTFSIILTAFKFKNVRFSIPYYSFKEGFLTTELKLFQLFPIFISSFCVVFVYPVLQTLINGSKSNTMMSGQAIPEQDSGLSFILHKPFQFGMPRLKYAMILDALPEVFINIASSVVIFRATRFLCGEKTTPTKTVTSGVFSESIINLMSSSFGLNPCSSALNIGLTSLTGVISQRIMQVCGCSLILIAIHPPTLICLSKLSVFHLQAVHFFNSMLVTIVGFSMMRKMEEISNREFTIIGSSIYASIFLPYIARSFESDVSLILPEFLLKLLSSDIAVSISISLLMDKLLRDERAVNEKYEGQKRDNNLSFSEELFSLCF